MSNPNPDRGGKDYSEYSIVELWDDTAYRKHHHFETAKECADIVLWIAAFTVGTIVLRGLTLLIHPDFTILLNGLRGLMFLSSLGLFAMVGATLYYKWQSNSLNSTITYRLEHPDGVREDITEREVAAIELGYDRDHFDDVSESEVPCPRCLKIH